MDPVYRGRGGSKSFGLPPPQFRSVHLRSGLMSSAPPHRYEDDDDGAGIASDYDDSSCEEHDLAAYSGDSSPLQDRIQWQRQSYKRYNTNANAGRGLPALQQREVYGRKFTYSDGRPVLSSQRQHEVSGDDYSVSSESFDERDADVHNSRYYSGNNTGEQTSSGFTSYDDYVEQRGENRRRFAANNAFEDSPQVQSKFSCDNRPNNIAGSRKSDVWPRNNRDAEVPSAPPMASSDVESIGAGPRSTPAFCRRATVKPSIIESGLRSSFQHKPVLYPTVDKVLDDDCSTDERRDPWISAGDSGNPISNPCPQPSTSSDCLPTYHLSGQSAWQALIAYEACVRLCLRAWARGCMEAPGFLENECMMLRNAFGIQQMLLQPEQELLNRKDPKESNSEGSVPKPKKTIGRIKVQVCKVRITSDEPPGCTLLSLLPKLDTLRSVPSNLQPTCMAGWDAVKSIRVKPRPPLHATYSQRGVAYVQASAQYVKQVSRVLKTGVDSLRNSSKNETIQETYTCLLKLKSFAEEAAFRVQPGSGETHVFLPESLGDDLIIEVQDSKGLVQGRVLIQLASLTEAEKTQWVSIFKEPEHRSVGRMQLFISYMTSTDEMGGLKCGSVAETVAYDLVLEVAMKIHSFQRRRLQIHGSWKWLLTEFASYYGVSEYYTKLRYLLCIMEVATPTEDCLSLVYDLLSSVIIARDGNSLSWQEKRILGDVEEQVDRLLALVFENYKSLDDSLPSGLIDVFGPATGVPAKALGPAVKLYTLLHDILSPEAQLNLCGYFQSAAKKRCKRHMAETDEFVANNNEGMLMDALTVSTAYLKMKVLCINIRNEVQTDIEIHNQHILPSSIDLPNIAAAIYNGDLCTRLRSFLVACPPSGPSQPVVELVIATADFQRDLTSWNISPVKGGVDAKDLFHLYIVLWIQDKRHSLLDLCKPDKVRMITSTTQTLVAPFVEEMYERIKEMLNEYEIIVCRWPEYTFSLENAIADVEKAIVEALEKLYADVLAPLKDSIMPKKFGLQYVQKWTKRGAVSLYNVPSQLAIFLNTIKRMLDVLRPKIELQLKSWVSCLPEGACGNMIFGERIGEVTVMLRAKFKNTVQAIIEKLADNTRMQKGTKIKKIIQDTKEAGGETEIRERMQLLNTQLIDTISHLHDIFTSRVFVTICRGFWERMGQDVLDFLENRKENKSWYKGARITVGILDDMFASQMQRLQGNALQEKDLEPPRSVVEVRSMLCKDASNGTGGSYYF